MKTFPPSSSPLKDPDSFDTLGVEERERVESQLRGLIDGRHPGILMTVDLLGCPRGRWMVPLLLDGMPHLYALTAKKSRKVTHIERDPSVSWLFGDIEAGLIATFTGTAKVCHSPEIRLAVWRRVRDRSREYFLRDCVKGFDYAVIETTLDYGEGFLPEGAKRFRIDVDRLEVDAFPPSPNGS
ncbi:MAG TPA: pyridoxamine 5'-phosphate oxidase family protein [Candidatus Methylacidiphilales bacterium]